MLVQGCFGLQEHHPKRKDTELSQVQYFCDGQLKKNYALRYMISLLFNAHIAKKANTTTSKRRQSINLQPTIWTLHPSATAPQLWDNEQLLAAVRTQETPCKAQSLLSSSMKNTLYRLKEGKMWISEPCFWNCFG